MADRVDQVTCIRCIKRGIKLYRSRLQVLTELERLATGHGAADPVEVAS